jgi:hypothetical protein
VTNRPHRIIIHPETITTLRQLGNCLVGILHGCLTTATAYDETTAWAHHQQDLQAAA